MSHIYTFQNVGIVGGEATVHDLYFRTMSPSQYKRVGYYERSSRAYQSAVSVFFSQSQLNAMSGKNIEAILLTVFCSGTFSYAQNICFNVKPNADTDDWTQEDYDHVVEAPKHGVIPIMDVTEFGIPEYYSYVVGSIKKTYSYVTITDAILQIVTDDTAKTLSYNANGGNGAPPTTQFWGNNEWSGYVSRTAPSRLGYQFVGWNTNANGSGTWYYYGDAITIYSDTTLYAQWQALTAVLDDVDDVIIGNSVTVTWTNQTSSSIFTNKMRFLFGTFDSGEIDVSGSAYTYSVPNSWNNQLPSAVSGSAVVYLYTYASGTFVGSDSRAFTVIVPDSVVPTIGMISSEKVNDNPIVAAQDIYLQEFSKTKISVSGCVAGQGATIVSYQFLGQNLNRTIYSSNTSENVTSDIIEENGSLTYTVKLTDSRGRSNTESVTISVVAYYRPAITYIDAVRCNRDGTENPVTGTTLKASTSFTWTHITGNTVQSSLSYKKHTDVSYTSVASSLVLDHEYIFAIESAAIDSSYDVKVEVSDALGNSIVLVHVIPPVVGIAFGLKNDRARFGGPTEEAGCVFDWDVKINGDFYVRKGNQSVSFTFEDFQALKALIE